MGILNILRKKLPDLEVALCIGIPYTKIDFLSCCNRGESDFIDSLELEFKTNDPEILWSKFEPVATNLLKTVNSLQNKNVKIINLCCVADLKPAFEYRTVILLAHRHRFLDSLDFMGNSIGIAELVDAIPPRFDGLMDISSCYSATFQMKSKQRAIMARFIATGTESSLPLKLFIIDHTIRYMASHPKASYFDSLSIIVRRIVNSYEERNQTKNKVFLGGKPSSFANSEENGRASAFTSNSISPGETMMVQIYIYEDDQYNQVVEASKKSDCEAEERDNVALNFNIKKGDKIDVNLRAVNFPKIFETKSVVWNGKTAKLCFFIEAPNNPKIKKMFISSVLSVNGAQLGELNFAIPINENGNISNEVSTVVSKQYKQVFISYSHLDEQNVKFIAQAYQALGINYFFDRHYLKAGDIFPEEIKNFIKSSDLFILCWSKNATESEYMKIELEEAMQRAYPKVAYEDRSRLNIYPISIIPRAALPPDVKDYYHIIEL